MILTKTTLTIEGMHCGSCALAIELILKEKEGVSSVKVDYNSKKAEVEFDENKVQLDDLKKEVSRIGFKAS